MEAELLHVDGQTDMTKLIVTFRHFANAPKNGMWEPPKPNFMKIPSVALEILHADIRDTVMLTDTCATFCVVVKVSSSLCMRLSVTDEACVVFGVSVHKSHTTTWLYSPS